jgi:hypothetical protein
LSKGITIHNISSSDNKENSNINCIIIRTSGEEEKNKELKGKVYGGSLCDDERTPQERYEIIYNRSTPNHKK